MNRNLKTRKGVHFGRSQVYAQYTWIFQVCNMSALRLIFVDEEADICVEDPDIPAPSNRSPLVTFADFKVAGGDLLEGPGYDIYIYIIGGSLKHTTGQT